MRWRIERLEEVGSTNDEARGGAEGLVIVARRQTRGRGQGDHTWSSEEGMNLTFSVVFEPRFIDAADAFRVSQMVALAIGDALREYGIEARLKWPNDVYVGGLKIAGILIENDVRGSVLARTVAGIGLNVNQTEFPADLPNPVSMRALTEREYSLDEVLEAVLAKLGERYEALRGGVDPTAEYEESVN